MLKNKSVWAVLVVLITVRIQSLVAIDFVNEILLICLTLSLVILGYLSVLAVCGLLVCLDKNDSDGSHIKQTHNFIACMAGVSLLSVLFCLPIWNNARRLVAFVLEQVSQGNPIIVWVTIILVLIGGATTFYFWNRSQIRTVW